MTRVRQNNRALPLDKVKLKSATGVDKEVSFKTLKAQISDTVGNTIIFVDSAQTTEQVISENRRIVFCKTEDADITVKVPDAPEEGWTCQIIKYEGNFNVVVQSESGTTQIGGLGETSQTISREGDSITIMYQTSSGSPGYVIVQDSRNSNLLDGVPGSGYLRSDANDTLTAVMKVDQSTAGSIIFEHDSNTGGYIPSPQGAAIHTSSSTPVTGAIKIALPANVSEDMLGFVVEIYDSATDESLTVFIKGYIHQGSGADEWKNESVYILSSATDFSRDYTVRFGNDGTNNCVWIGETSSVWSYPQVIVRDFFGGYTTDIDDYATGWDITFETAFDTIDTTHSNNLVVAGDSENLAGASAAFYLDWNNFTNVPSTFTPSAHTHDASDITSGTFPDARIDSATNWNTAYNYSQIGHLPLSGGSVSGTITTSGLTATTDPIDAQGDLRGRSNFRLDSYAPASGHNLLIVGTDGTVYTRNENYYTTQNWVTSQGYQTASDVSTIIENDVDKSFVDALNVDADTLDGIDSTGFALASHTHTTSDITNLSSYTGFDTRYYTETEINNKFSGVAATSGYNKTNWDTAYGWGDHATQGYQTASDVSTIITNDVDKTFIDNLNVDADTLDGQDSTYYLAWNNITGKPSTFTPSAHTHDAGDITSGTFPDSRIDSASNWNTAYNYSQVGHIPNSQKGNANGVATLDGNGKVPLTQINDSIIGQVEYKGLWNASTNTPTLPTTPTEKGHYYIVSTSGTQFGESYEVGDWIISDGSSWSKVDNTDAVSSVFGRTGNVSAIESDYQSFYPRLSQSYANPTWISSLAWSKITGVPLTFTPSAHTHTTSDITDLSSYTGFDSRYYTESEINNFFSGTTAITGYNRSNWDTAHGWGDHATQGYQTAGDVATIIASDVDKAFVDALNVDADTLDGQDSTYYLAWNNLTGVPSTFTPSAHTHAASDITSGTFDAARIPNLSASKITSGTFANARIAQSNVTQHQAALSIGWSQLTSVPTYDNYVSWNLKTNGIQRTTVGSGGVLDVVGAGSTSVSYGAGGIVTISSTDTNTTYTAGTGLNLNGTSFSINSGYTGFDARYYTETEINDKFSGASATTGYNKTNWDSAYGWGDHASAGYALDAGVVHIAGTETITGAKTFSANMILENGYPIFRLKDTDNSSEASLRSAGGSIQMLVDSSSDTFKFYHTNTTNLWATIDQNGVQAINKLEVYSSLSGSAGSYTGHPVVRIKQVGDRTYNIGDVHGAIEWYSEDASSDPVAAYPNVNAYIKAVTTRGDGIGNPDAGLVFGTSTVNNPTYGDVARDVVMINHQGYVGIGKMDPAFPLDVVGTINTDTHYSSVQWAQAYGWGDWSTGVDKAFVDALNVDADTLDGIDSTGFALAGHTHTTSDITNLSSYTGFDTRYYTETEINNRFSGATAAAGYNKTNWDTAHGWGDHALAGYELQLNKGTANGYAPLGSDAKIPNSFLPALAITDTFVVASQAAMLALSAAEQGDVAVRTDINKSFILTDSSFGTLSSWQELLTPLDTVTSVNGLTGAVQLSLGFTPSTGVLTLTGSPSVNLGFTSSDVSNWNTAFGWGNHATQGYQTAGDVATIIASDVDKAFVDALNVDADTLDGQDSAYYLAWNNITGKPSTFTPSAHTHAAGDVTSGTFATARIPNLSASKITSGTFPDARIASASNWNTAYNYSQVGHLPLTGGTLTGDLLLEDNQELQLGTSADFVIDHNGTNTVADNKTGNLVFRNLSTGTLTSFSQDNSSGTNQTGITIDGVGAGVAVDLYYGGDSKLTTTSTGIDVTGVISATGGDSDDWNTAFGWGDWSTGVDKAFVDALNIDADTLDGQNGTYYLAWNNLTGVPSTFTPSAHTHAAGDITSGTFLTARIPNLSASKITSGTFADARIASATNWNTAYTYSQVGHIPISQKGSANGVATLDGNGKVPLTQINDSIIGQVEYKGLWNAATNTPTLPATPTEKGHYYIVSTAGTQFGESYEIGDWIISDGSSWSKVDNTDAVSSVFGRTGNVSAVEADYQSFYPRLSQSYANPTWISSLAWNKLTNVPSTFTPSAHTHTTSQITNLSSYTGFDARYYTETEINDKFSGASATTGYNKTNWDAAYTYSQVGHLPLTGGTLTGELTVRRSSGRGIRIIHTVSGVSSAPYLTWENSDGELGYIGYGSTGNNDLSISNKGAFNIRIYNNGTERLRINSSGDVGIGTTNPSTKLDVNGVITATGGNSTNWNTAFGWGNHASEGYQTAGDVATIIASDVDKAFVDALNVDADTLDGIDSSGFVTRQNTAYTDMNSSRISSMRRYDPNTNNPDPSRYYAALTYGNQSNVVGQFATDFQTGESYVRSYNTSWSAWRKLWDDQDFTSSNITNWNTAYGWGDHATQGYQTAGDVSTIIASDVDKAFVDALNIDADTLDGQNGTYYLAWNNLTGVPSTFTPSAHTHNASDVTSGTFANARISQGSVTQHEGALTINWSQLFNVPAYDNYKYWNASDGTKNFLVSANGSVTWKSGANVSVVLDNQAGEFQISATNNYVSSLSFSGGTLTLGRQGLSSLSTSLDGRYLRLSNGTNQTVTGPVTFESVVQNSVQTATASASSYSWTPTANTLKLTVTVSNLEIVLPNPANYIGDFSIILVNNTSGTGLGFNGAYKRPRNTVIGRTPNGTDIVSLKSDGSTWYLVLTDDWI